MLRKEKLSPTTSDVNLDCLDSELSWLQMVSSTTKIPQNSSNSQRNEENLTSTLPPVIYNDLYFFCQMIDLEDSVHQCRKNTQKTASNDSTTSSTSKLRSYRKYQGRDLLNAIEEVRAGNMTAHTASRKYGVPSRTVYDKVKKIRDGLEVYIAK